MSRLRIAGWCVMGWVLTASGSLAGPVDLFDRAPAAVLQLEPRRLERAEVVDSGTGAELKLTARSGGALQASLTWTELEVTKTIQPNGDFHARLAWRQDLLVLVRTGNRLRVTRAGQTAALALDRSDEEALDGVQAVLAGSHAVRAFRGLHQRLSQESRWSAPGVPVDMLDALLGVLQGDPGAVAGRAPARREAGWRLSRAAFGMAATCYSEYEGEVCSAWDDFTQCIQDVAWYPLLQEVCAFAWLLRVESAWFRFIGCSSIPLKVA